MRLRQQGARGREEELSDDLAGHLGGERARRLAGAGTAAERVDLETALAQLPATARAVIWLHDVEGYSHDEIAAMAGRTASFSKSQLARAHARLREMLAPGSGGTMHLSLEELLAVRDGVAGAAVGRARRVLRRSAPPRSSAWRPCARRSPRCPRNDPSNDLWPAVVARAAGERERRMWRRAGWIAAGLAAMFTIAIGVRGALEAYAEAKLARQTETLVAESQRLEKRAPLVRRRERVMSGRTAGTVVQLEDRIATIDAQLARAGNDRYPSRERIGLWQERVRLLDALVSVEKSGTTYLGL